MMEDEGRRTDYGLRRRIVIAGARITAWFIVIAA